jgi:hypothetical protein
MRRIDNNGHIEFDANNELDKAKEQIEYILATLNPAHPNTLESIIAIVQWYGARIDAAWSHEGLKGSEYTDRTLQDARQGSATTLAAILAGIQVGRDDSNG